MNGDDGRSTADRSAIGLCESCRHLRRQPTKRGAIFYRCARADRDPRFPRYPPIPVERCTGHEPVARDGTGASD